MLIMSFSSNLPLHVLAQVELAILQHRAKPYPTVHTVPKVGIRHQNLITRKDKIIQPFLNKPYYLTMIFVHNLLVTRIDTVNHTTKQLT